MSLCLGKLILPIIASIPLVSNLNDSKYYQVDYMRSIEENEGIRLYIKISTLNRIDTSLVGNIYLINDTNKTTVGSYSYNLKSENYEYVSNIIPYSSFTSENAYIQNDIDVDSKYEQKGSLSLKYYPNKLDNSKLKISEADNGKYIDTKYIHESYDANNGDYNFSHYDKIKFNNFKDFYFKEGYSFFDISYLNFNYDNGVSIVPKGEYYLYLFDSYNLFPRFEYLNDTMYKIFPLKIIQEDGLLKFNFKSDLYYNPYSLELSPIYLNGYEKTQYLYLPNNEFDKLKNINMRIFMNINGFMDFTVTLDFEIAFEKKLYGECDEAEYCTNVNDEQIGGVSEEENYNI